MSVKKGQINVYVKKIKMKKLLLLIVLSLLVSCDDEIETTRTESEENSYLKFEYLKFLFIKYTV